MQAELKTRFDTEAFWELAPAVAYAVDAAASHLEGRVSAQWKWLLAAVVYSYARGIYSSDEIESTLRVTELGTHLEAHSSSNAIRELRRHHRKTLEDCLAEVLRLTARSPENALREAQERVLRAIRLDSYALDY